jgi:hypothetical protein
MKKLYIYTLVLFLTGNTAELFGQGTATEQQTVTQYFHIKGKLPAGAYRQELEGFILQNIDTSNKINWQSPLIKDYELEQQGYFLKANLPTSIQRNSRHLQCSGVITSPVAGGIKRDTIDYGGVNFNRIKLILKSTPEGAESFLIPNRIWTQKFSSGVWKKENSLLEKYRVNTSSTNTYAYVDETVFVVLYKIKDKFKKTIHYTKPARIETEQTVWVNFGN